MHRVIFLRHGSRVSGQDVLLPVGLQQARAAGVLLQQHGFAPHVGFHTTTQRTRHSLRLAMAEAGTVHPIPHGPRTLTALHRRLAEWTLLAPQGAAMMLCAHHSTQHLLCAHLGLPISRTQRALLVFDAPPEHGKPLSCLAAWQCEPGSAAWQAVC